MTRYIPMSFFTLGIYQFYWIYKNWEYLKNRDQLQIHPFWRGWFGIFFCDRLLKEIHDDTRLKHYKPAEFHPTSLAAGWIIFSIGSRLFDQYTDKIFPDDLAGIAILIFIFMLVIRIWFFLPVQQYINEANEKIKPAALYYPWSAGHFILLGLTLAMVLFSAARSG